MAYDSVVELLLAGDVDDQDVPQWCEVLHEACQLIVDGNEPSSWEDWVADRHRGWSRSPAHSMHHALRVQPVLTESELRTAAEMLLEHDPSMLESFYRGYAAQRAAARAAAATRRHHQPAAAPAEDRFSVDEPVPEPASLAEARARRAPQVDTAGRETFTAFATRVVEILQEKHPSTFESVPTAQLAKLTVDAIVRARAARR